MSHARHVKSFAVAAIVLASWRGPVTAEAPFSPLPNVPDYIATFVSKAGPVASRIVTHHGEWARIDGKVDNRILLSTYAKTSEPLTITVQRNLTSFQILRGADAHRDLPGADYNQFKNGEQDVILGETCDVWVVFRSYVDGAQNKKIESRRLSCISKDGIELRNWFSGSSGFDSSISAVSVERRPVEASDVTPPADLFELKTWLSEPAPRSDNPYGDATVWMETQGAGSHPRQVGSRVVRRHGPWVRSEDIYGSGQRRGVITNDSQRLTVTFEVRDGQLTRLNLSKAATMEEIRQVRGVRPIESKEQETVLGETCNWFDMWPGVMDAGRHECRTGDGLVLKEKRFSRGSTIELVATRIERAPVPLNDVSPAAMLARSNWGLPD